MPDMEKGVKSFVLFSSKECFVQKLDKRQCLNSIVKNFKSLQMPIRCKIKIHRILKQNFIANISNK